MRRLIVLAMLVLLPLQYSWAAVAAYCAHETQAGAGHFGHHEPHEHAVSGAAQPEAPHTADAADDAGASDDGQTPRALDLDCGHCHGQLIAMPSLSAALPGLAAMKPRTTSARSPRAALAPNRPERPQWPPLA